MSAIKKFFQKKKTDAKFKLAGQGHSLNQNTNEKHYPRKPENSKSVEPRLCPSESSARAGQAALARFEHHQQTLDPFANRSKAAVRAEARKEMLSEMGKTHPPNPEALQNQEIKRDNLAVSGVYFSCALIGNDVLPWHEMVKRIHEFLYEQLSEERGLTSCLIIHTCNKDREKVKTCVETLSKYLSNIIENPGEEKYRRIRLNNKAYQERVACMEGSLDFLLAAGFHQTSIPGEEGNVQEEFLVFPIETLENMENLVVLRDALQSAEPIYPQLDRGVTVLLPSSVPQQKLELPPEFFRISADELKREQNLKSEEVERNAVLRTKAMREREEQREQRKYRFCLLRIRFPDDFILQGTFYVHENLSAVREFILEHLEHEWVSFTLTTATNLKLETDESASLMSLQLAPAAILNFVPDQDSHKQLQEISELRRPVYLKQETRALARNT